MEIRNDRNVTVHIVPPGTPLGAPLMEIGPGAVVEVPDVLEDCPGGEDCSMDHLHRVPDGFSEVTDKVASAVSIDTATEAPEPKSKKGS